MQSAAGHFAHDYHGQTTLHPVGLALLLAMGVLMLLLPRRQAIWPMLVIACFVAPAQRIVVLGSDFSFLRIMVVFGVLRLWLHNEFRPLAWHRLDVAVIAWALAHVGLNVARAGTGVLMGKLGFAFDAIGMYILFRMLIRDWEDVRSLAIGAALLSIPVAAAFLLEWRTGRNAFAVFGGVPQTTVERFGRLRCQGAFAHPILAGLFWVSLLPLIGALWWRGGAGRVLAWAGGVCALAIAFTCSSATPIAVVFCVGLGAAAFLVRNRMRLVRWTLLVTVVGLHAVMTAPVWHLITRIDLIGGSSGWHRFKLIDSAIRHMNEWLVLGTTRGTAHWGPMMYDVTNTYIVQGLEGGLLLLVVFVVVIALAFRAVGCTWRANARDPERLFWSWALGVMLFAHVVSFAVITYFGQIIMLWYLTLAVVGSMQPVANAQPVLQRSRRRAVVATNLDVRQGPTALPAQT